MTAQQVAALGRADELPLAASHPKVAVRATLVGESDQCCRHPLQAGEDVAPPGRWAVQYRFDYAHPVRTERVCPDCAQDELQELLDWGVCHLELHLPADWSSMSIDTPKGWGPPPPRLTERMAASLRVEWSAQAERRAA
jgi:hypothetical protein